MDQRPRWPGSVPTSTRSTWRAWAKSIRAASASTIRAAARVCPVRRSRVRMRRLAPQSSRNPCRLRCSPRPSLRASLSPQNRSLRRSLHPLSSQPPLTPRRRSHQHRRSRLFAQRHLQCRQIRWRHPARHARLRNRRQRKFHRDRIFRPQSQIPRAPPPSPSSDRSRLIQRHSPHPRRRRIPHGPQNRSRATRPPTNPLRRQRQARRASQRRNLRRRRNPPTPHRRRYLPHRRHHPALEAPPRQLRRA